MGTDLPSFSFDPQHVAETLPQTRSIGGFWRRFFAFVVDGMILAFLGWCIGLFFFETLCELGLYGRLLGFLIAVPYFAVMESNIGGGQSFGKRLLNLRVVDAQGNTLSFERSFARYTICSLPVFLNGISFPFSTPPWVVITVLGPIVFGMPGATLYLMIFNRNTRQGLHDLAVGSYVVRASDTGSVVTKPIWKKHWAFLGFMFVTFTVITTVFISYTEKWERFPQIMQDLWLIQQMDYVQNASAQEPRLISGSGERSRKILTVNIVWAGNPADQEAFAGQAARIILQNDQRVQDYDQLHIVITRGFNIGFASAWHSNTFHGTPAEWQEHIFGASPATGSIQTTQ